MNFDASQSKTAIVLTGTIIPNTILNTKYFNIDSRRKEYLTSIHFYKNFAPVYFLENSVYALHEDSGFQNISNVTVYQLSSPLPERGKGFQEFNMLDQWIELEDNLPSRWIKVTGRYLYTEFEKIWDECLKSQDISLIMNQYLLANHSDTALFCVDTSFYKRYLSGLYLLCDDRKGMIIEKVVSNRLKNVPKHRFKRFKTHLICTGISGHNGKNIRRLSVDRLNSAVRDINYRFDSRYIWLSF
jgi:hypothetical protein